MNTSTNRAAAVVRRVCSQHPCSQQLLPSLAAPGTRAAQAIGRAGLLAVLLAASPATAQPVQVRPIVRVEDPIPGRPGEVFRAVNLQTPYTVNGQGDVVFTGARSVGGAILSVADRSGLRVIAFDGPGTTISYGSFLPTLGDSTFPFNAPIVARVASTSTLNTEGEDGFLALNAVGTAVPGLEGWTYASSASPVTAPTLGPGGHLAFLNNVSTPGETARALIAGRFTSNELRAIARTVRQPAVGFADFGAPVVNASGVVACYARFLDEDGVLRLGLARWQPGQPQLEVVVRSGSQAPGQPQGITFSAIGAFFASNGNPYLGINSSGAIAFGARLAGPGIDFNNDGCIWIYQPGAEPVLLFREGEPVPGDPTAIVSTLFDGDTPTFPLISDSGHVLANARVRVPPSTTTFQSLILFSPDASVREVARTGRRLPGPPQSPVNYQTFFSWALSREGRVMILTTGALVASDDLGRMRLLAAAQSPVRLPSGDLADVSQVTLGSNAAITGGSDGRGGYFTPDSEVVAVATLRRAGNVNESGKYAFRIPQGCTGADFDANGQTDFFDYLGFVEAFGAGNLAADFDQNGRVDFFDYLDFSSVFAEAC
ncbi:MAG: hypothetical protein SFZ23_00510 [Planctomycetota bacterium]|nr:hypothetical protein [Planctomycetota bacterium]